MKIHRLEIEGFGPFRDRQVVDFDAFADDGIFLISGRTGAGKSSILDAVCFALYGSVPRYEDGDKRLRSDHSESGDKTLVTLEFSSGTDRWRIERAPEFARPKRRGAGTTNQPAEARMAKWVASSSGEGGWQGQAARPVDVGVLLDEIIGLNQQQFLQVILLAQNRFARFLLAKNDERQSLLRTLFGTRTFDAYEKALDARRRDAEAALGMKNQALLAALEQAESMVGGATPADMPAEDKTSGAAGVLSGDVGSRLARITQEALRARHVVETAAALEATASTARTAADAAHATLVSQREKQGRRTASRVALAALDARSADVAAYRDELDAAQRAEALRTPIEAARRAAAAVDDAVAVEQARLTEWRAVGGVDRCGGSPQTLECDVSTVPEPESLENVVAALSRDVGEWSAALVSEESIPQAQAAAQRYTHALQKLDAQLAENDERRRTLPSRRDALDGEIAAAARIAATVSGADAHVSELAERLAAAADAETLTAAASAASHEALQSGKALTDASAQLDTLRERRLAGYAGELAESLEIGEPCAVCGSTDHPAPAPRGGDPVTPENIAAAEQAKILAWEADQRSAAKLRHAERVAAAALALSRGLDTATLETSLAHARAAFTEAQDAAARGMELVAERTAVAEQLAQAESAHAALAAERGETLTHLATTTQALEAANAATSLARGPFPSVRLRIVDAEARLDAGRSLADALRATERARLGASATAADLAEALAGGSFDSEAAAAAALRDAPSRERLASSVREYDAARSGERSTLLQLELDMLPEEEIDTSVTQQLLAQATQAWSGAVAARAAAEQRAETLASSTARADAAHDAIAELAAQVAAVERLANTVAGRAPNTKRMKLETFVLAAELEEIVDAANVRLAAMSDGRYTLQHTDALLARGAASGLGIEVMDRYTGQARPPQSLSGGETFLASLALALGLAEVVTGRAGGITLDTLFIDEGFGALDPETLDVAMRTLDELRQGGRTVGIISHVEAMKEQIPAQLQVEVTPHGWSAVRSTSLAFPR